MNLREDVHLFVNRRRLLYFDGTRLKDGALRTAKNGEWTCLFRPQFHQSRGRAHACNIPQGHHIISLSASLEAHFHWRSIPLHAGIEANIFLELHIGNRNSALRNIGPLLRIQRIYAVDPLEFPFHDDLTVIDAVVTGLAG